MSFLNKVMGGDENESLRSRMGKVLLTNIPGYYFNMPDARARLTKGRLRNFTPTARETYWTNVYVFFLGGKGLVGAVRFKSTDEAWAEVEYWDFMKGRKQTEDPNPQPPPQD